MFFISWGSRGKVVDGGPAGHLHCAFCDQDSYFRLVIAYTVRHIYWIFRWVTDRHAYTTCGNCGGAHGADLSDYPREAKQAIPKWDRFGWAAGLGGIGAIIATGSIAAAADHAADQTYIAAPHTGDIYEIDLAQLMKQPEAPQMYTTARVVKIEGQQVEVELAKGYYKEWRGVDKDLNDGTAATAEYYSADHLAIPIPDIAKMQASGVIHDVRR
jgi:hypothetical protein